MDYRARLQESLFDVLGSFRRCLHENEPVLPSEHLTLIGADLSPRVQVALIANEHDRHIGVAVLLDFLQPSGEMGEGIPPRDVVDEECARRTAIVRTRNTLERFLASRVPDLQLDVLLLDLDGASTKLDSDGQIVLLTEPLVRELEKKAGFSDTCVSNDDVLE